MHNSPNYLYLTISLLTAVVLITSADPEGPLMTLGISVAALSFMVTSYFVIESRRQLLLAAFLGIAALLPFMWLTLGRKGHSPILVQSLFILNLVIWLLFTLYIAVIVFRSIMSARRIRNNEIYGAIYVYLLIGVSFAEIYQLLLAWHPDAIYFDPGRFPPPLVIGSSGYTPQCRRTSLL